MGTCRNALVRRAIDGNATTQLPPFQKGLDTADMVCVVMGAEYCGQREVVGGKIVENGLRIAGIHDRRMLPVVDDPQVIVGKGRYRVDVNHGYSIRIKKWFIQAQR